MQSRVTWFSLERELNDATKIGTREVDEVLERLYEFIDSRLAREGRVPADIRAKYMMGWIPHAMSKGLINIDQFYKFLMSRPSLENIVLVVMMISRGYTTLEEVNARLLRTLNNQFSRFLEVVLDYLFEDADVTIVMEYITSFRSTVTINVIASSLLNCCAEVSGPKTRTLASLLVSKYGCEHMFAAVAVDTNKYTPDYELFTESIVISSCDRPISKYSTSRVSTSSMSLVAMNRLTYLLSLPEDSV